MNNPWENQQQNPNNPPPTGLMPTGMPPTVQQPTGVARTYAWVKTLTLSSIGLAVIVFVLQAIAPAGGKPSDLIGGFHGATRSAELDAERRAHALTTQTLANAQAGPPANWQMEQQLFATQQQTLAKSLEGQANLADLADTSCIAGGVVGMLFGRDGEQFASALQSACGAGDAIRRRMADTLANTARDGSGVMQRTRPVNGYGSGAQPTR